MFVSKFGTTQASTAASARPSPVRIDEAASISSQARPPSPATDSISRISSAGAAAIQSLSSQKLDAELALAKVKAFVRTGMFQHVGGERGESLQLAASSGSLDALPPLTLEQERALSSNELRVYIEARYGAKGYNAPLQSLEAADPGSGQGPINAGRISEYDLSGPVSGSTLEW